MVIATSYPFFGVLWTTLIFFAWVIFIWIAITVLIDVFRRHDISGWGKAAWVVFVVIIPWIGVLVYLIVQALPRRLLQRFPNARAVEETVPMGEPLASR